MAGEDTTSSALELPPLTPKTPAEFSRKELLVLAENIISATWRSGLPQWSWGEGVYLLSEVRFRELQSAPISQQLLEWYKSHKTYTSGHINNVAPGAGAVRLNRAKVFDGTEMLDTIDTWLSDPSAATRSRDGAIEHWPDSIWADTCFMLGTYALNKGVAFKEPTLIDFIGEQLILHMNLLQHPQRKLFAHGSHRGETIWNFWGRGNAWTAISAVEFLDACEALQYRSPHIEKIKESLDSQLVALIKLLPEYGIWDVLVDGQVENRGVLETSATAGIGSALIRSARHFPENQKLFLGNGMRACAAALTYVDQSGVLTRTSAGTVLQLIPFGYSVIRSDRLQLWGQGLALFALSSMLWPEKNQIAFPN